MTTVADVDMTGWVRQSASPIRDGDFPLTARDRQNLIFEDLFDGGALDSSFFNRSLSHSDTTAAAVDETNNWLVIDHDRALHTKRTEVILKGLPVEYYNNAGQSVIIGVTNWYGFSVYLPPDFVLETSAPEIFMQWHGKADAGEDNRNPNVSLGIYDDGNTVLLSILGDGNAITPPVGSDPRYDRADNYTIGDVTSMLGVWTNFVFRVKWAYDSTGELTLYKNGVSVHSEINKANCFNDDFGSYWKLGLYKWVWDNVDLPVTDTTTRLMYYDNIRVGNENATLADVWENHA